MTGPTLLPFATTPLAVTQTLVRVGAAADYIAPYAADRSTMCLLAGQWSDQMKEGDVEALMRTIRDFDIVPFRHLTAEDKTRLGQLSLSHPSLRAELQLKAEDIERAIGVFLPLRIAVFSGRPSHRCEGGMALFLRPTTPTDETIPIAAGLQVFTLATETSSEEETVRIAVGRHLRDLGHADKIRTHFARKDIEAIASMEPAGRQVTPLAAPTHVTLSETITRMGQFCFLGLDRAVDLDPLKRLAHQADVLVLGAMAASESSFADDAIAALKPRVVLVPLSNAAPIRRSPGTAVFAASSEATLEFDPTHRTISLHHGRRTETVRSDKPGRLMNIIDNLRPGVTQELVRKNFGQSAAQLILNGAVPMAHRYLFQLDSDPHRYASVPAREEVLAKIIADMTDPLSLRDTVADHIWALKELLLRSGLLEKRG